MNIEEIKSQFSQVISHSQGIETPHIDELFNNWIEAKRDFIEAFGGEPIYEWPDKVSFELGPSEKNVRLNDFINMIENRYDNYDLVRFIEHNRAGFFSNQVVDEYEYDGNIIPKGMKLLRAFKFFEDSPTVLEQLQNAASMIIQEDKIEGTLCLSVHPLDFLSTSENNHNWRSCHALDGEYRSGNLSHMIDSSTIICYIKSNREEVLPNFPSSVKWNSKKWRVLFYFSDKWDMIFAGRQYPFATTIGIDFVKEKVFPRVHLGDFSSWLSKKYKEHSEKEIYATFHSAYVPVGGGLVPLDELMVNLPGSMQFNDVLSSSCYDPVYAYRLKGSYFREYAVHHKMTRFHVGGQCKCTRCGEAPIEISSSFMCNECELEYGNSEDDMFAYCPCCGRRFFYDDGVYVDGAEESVCPSCARTETIECENCGELFYSNTIVFDRKTERHLCQCCYEDLTDLIEGE